MELNVNLNNFTKIKKLRNLLESKLTYFSDRFYQVSKSGFLPIENCKNIVIVAAKHYQLEVKEYPSISRKELDKLLKLQSTTLHGKKHRVIAKPSIDGFEVKTVSIFPEVLNKITQGKVIIPETELLIGVTAFSQEIDTPAGRLFVHEGSYAYQSGLMPSFELFCYGAGASNTISQNLLRSPEYSKKLNELLFELPLAYLSTICIISLVKQQNPLSLHWLYGVPLLTSFITLLSFVAIDTYQLHAVESALQSNRKNIDSLLTQKSLADKKQNLVISVNNILAERELTFPVWQVVFFATQQEMLISSLRMSGGEIQLRGNAPTANEVLTAVAQIKGVKDTAFEGNVRNVRGKEHFTITFRLEGDAREAI